MQAKISSRPDSLPKSNHAAVVAASADRYDLRILNAIRQIIRTADVDSRKLAAEHNVTAVHPENSILAV